MAIFAHNRSGQVSTFGGLALALALMLMAGGCGGSGGGGGGSSFDSHATLLAIEFPDPEDLNTEPTTAPPQTAPLAQQVVFVFSHSPDPNSIGATSLPVRDPQGFAAPGTYDVNGPVVTFTPALPTAEATLISESKYDTGGTGLEPATSYTIRVGPASFPFVANVAESLRLAYPDPSDASGVILKFTTTNDPTRFHGGLVAVTPQLVAVDPEDGTTGVSPGLFTDPDHVFPARQSFTLSFDRAVNPDTTNVGEPVIQLIDLDDRPASFPNGLPLGINVRVAENETDHAAIEVTASGILPFGHLLALQYQNDLRGLSENGTPTGSSVVAMTFTIADAPAGTIRDLLTENFDTNDRQETSTAALGVGELPAEWNVDASGVLNTGFAFDGHGEIGRFAPPAPPTGDTKVITLDTSRQVFPLFDGSTPDAPPGLEILGGVFPFTDIDIPDAVVIKTIGPNPLVFTATGSVRIAGKIDMVGQNGTPDNAYDSSVTSVPGGAGSAGGGRGGAGHPIVFFPTDQVSYLNLVSPSFGERGFGIDAADGNTKQIGGVGGTCGMLDIPDVQGKYATNQEIDCNEVSSGNGNNTKVPGGGGGSLLVKGKAAKDGVGNVYPDGTGRFTAIADTVLHGGAAGDHPFFNDGDSLNDFIGSHGQVTRLVAGQGGGGGATKTESYYCGIWCDHDTDPTNDNVCAGTDFGSSPSFGDSVGDARGGGAGGGGGAFLVQALGTITLDPTADILAYGGTGGGGEALGCSNWGGSGGGGSGGAVLLQSASTIVVQSGALIDVHAGLGDNAMASDNYITACTDDNAPGSGGNGGGGIVQLQVPLGSTATVVNPNSIVPPTAWVDPTNTLNPAEFTPISIAISTWYDFGRVIKRAPLGANPVFSFGGLDGQGFVQTDSSGNVLDPPNTDIVVDYLGQFDPVTRQYLPGEEPREDFIPPNAKVKVEFQGADSLVEGSKEVDPGSLTSWSVFPGIANGHQFIRWRVTFDLAANPGDQLTPDTRRPTVQSLQIHSEF